ncbi:MAG: hypothetical protein PHV07_08735, partial [Oscillospiraceae bacterium]|nr:hypothetical protein [Oscillospiraceae bacterium]
MMKIIECYIENFGRLHQFSFKFNDRLNTINELNGWGKTTFSTFIRAMFYGMEATRTKKNLEDDERRKYKPWQGGNFGGYIIFELNDKVYKVERFFADKSKDDTFVLYNQNTGLESKDFSANIGEEIFKLDKAAYSRSTYIPQNEINIAANDSINAKLSNLIENNNANDINNYDLAMKLLEKSKKEYVKTGSRGKLDIIKNKITATESDLKICLAKAEATDEWNERLGKILGQKKEIKEKLQNVKNQVDNASKYETRTAKLQQYTELCDTEKKLQADFEPFDTFFKGDLPTEDRLNKCDEISSELLKVKGELKSYELTDYEKTENQKLKEVFLKGVPSEKTINDCEAFISKYRENEIKIEANKLTVTESLKKAELDKFFAKGVPTESEIDKFIDVIPKLNEIKSKITTENSKLEILKNVQLQNTQQNNKKPKNTLLPIGIVVALLGIALLFLYFPAGIGCIIAGGILFALSFVKAKKQPSAAGNGQDSNMAIQKFVDDLTMQKQSIEAELNNFLGQFEIEINPDNYYAS